MKWSEYLLKLALGALKFTIDNRSGAFTLPLMSLDRNNKLTWILQLLNVYTYLNLAVLIPTYSRVKSTSF